MELIIQDVEQLRKAEGYIPVKSVVRGGLRWDCEGKSAGAMYRYTGESNKERGVRDEEGIGREASKGGLEYHDNSEYREDRLYYNRSSGTLCSFF